jgi:hypothetical protein
MLTFGTMAITTRVITVLKFPTFFATEYLSAQAFGTAGLNCPHRLTMRGEEFVGIFFSGVSTILLKEVSQF